MRLERPLTITPSQTVGPFYAYCLTPTGYDFPPLAQSTLATEDAVGKRITLRGQVLDGDAAPVPDGMIEIWQPDGEGRFAGHHAALEYSSFKGFGRANCDDSGFFTFDTVKPGQVMTRDGQPQAPHIAVAIFGKGINRQLWTRIYFDDEESNSDDPILALVPAELRPSLIAKCSANDAYEIVFRLQGAGETVFFQA